MKIVYASFEEKGATWEVIMYDSGTQRQIRRLRFEDSNKLIEMARRGQGLGNLEAKQALDYGIDHGKGGMFLKLTVEQYEQLKRIRP